MKKFLLTLCLIMPLLVYADDTVFIQNCTNAGSCVLPVKPGGYFISSVITVRNNLDFNGQTVTFTGASGDAFLIPAIDPNLTIHNGTLIGNSNVTNPSGTRGIEYAAANTTIDHMNISFFSGYGILSSSNAINVTVTNNNITQCGYMCAFFTGSPSNGGLISHNTFDRSYLPNTTVTQGAMLIRGTAIDTSYNWTVTHNTFIMPVNPTDISAEDVEIRFAKYCRVDSNSFQNGSIGLSLVSSKNIKSKGNTYTGQNLEAYEYAATHNSVMDSENISSQVKYGILLDGTPTNGGATLDTIINCTISGTGSHSIFAQGNVHQIDIENNTVTAKTYAIYLQQADNFSIFNNTLNGGGVATNPVILNNSIGLIAFSCGGVTAFTGKNLFIYGSTPIVTNNVNLVNFTSTLASGYSFNLSGGATIGSSISVIPVTTPAGCSSVVAPNISYTNQTFTALTTISPVSPSNSGGTASAFSISPAIPAGLSFNLTTGVITGTPTPHQAAITYTIIASNIKGADTTTFTIAINNPAFTFGALPTKTYGAADFSPGATSPATITYTSSNLAVAAIVSNNIHITGQGTSTITANNSYQTIPQTLTVNKASLTISANNKTKLFGKPNPPLNVTYSGFVLGQTNSVLTSQPTTSTTAVTGSPVGTYPITSSGAAASNYTISYVDGVLLVYPNSGPIMIHGKLLH